MVNETLESLFGITSTQQLTTKETEELLYWFDTGDDIPLQDALDIFQEHKEYLSYEEYLRITYMEKSNGYVN